MTVPYWMDSSAFPRYAKLNQDLTVDTVVVGGGITGLTTAYLLTKAGQSVAVLERQRCVGVDTGHTSAHLTMVTDTRLRELVQRFGRSHAQAAWDAGLAAISQIEELVAAHAMDVGFEWVDGFLHVPRDADEDAVAALRDDAALAASLGFSAEFVDRVPAFDVHGIRFEGQARIHPRAYLADLAKALTAQGGRIFEHSEANEFLDEPLAVKANGHTIRCQDVVIATHTPLVGVGGTLGAALFQTKLALYTSYVVAGRIRKGIIPDALWWDTADPYYYLRVEPHRDHDLLIFGGQDHKTGQADDTAECFEALERELKVRVPDVELTHRWSGQVIETPDGLPFIGRTSERQYAATGYAGNGLTFGTLAAVMISEQIMGRTNPWTELFDPGRKAMTRGLWDYIKENADYPYYMVRDRILGAEGKTLRSVRRGGGAIIERDGQKVAAYRDERGYLTLRSPICTHMGCLVGWNASERTWDCPCHGSRFTPAGDVISGPAEAPLPPLG
jgi:glycine/D-amino acid oxidase-like deaminating enzyme/nitrite reductase/ring-hydroxylating ferredoxin subunit